MSNSSRLIAALIVFAGLVAGAIVVFFAGRWLILLFGQLDRQVAIVTGIATATILFAAIIVRGRNLPAAADRTSAIQSRKLDVYKEVLRFDWYQTGFAPGDSTESTDQQESATLLELLLLGSPRVLKLHAQIVSQSNQDQSAVAADPMQKLIQEMRKDLGQTNLGIRPEILQNLSWQTSTLVNRERPDA